MARAQKVRSSRSAVTASCSKCICICYRRGRYPPYRNSTAAFARQNLSQSVSLLLSRLHTAPRIVLGYACCAVTNERYWSPSTGWPVLYSFWSPFLESVIAFWRELLKNPRGVGSITPSGAALGAAIAEVVLKEQPGCVVELGAGTGAITRSLVEIRSQLDDLIVIEKSTDLAALLASRYPALEVVPGCASLIGQIDFPAGRPLTIVSSLPLRSLPPDELAAVKKAIAVLSERKAGFRFIQYSYFGRVPFINHNAWLTWEKMHTVLANIPPATVWLLRAQPPRVLRTTFEHQH